MLEQNTLGGSPSARSRHHQLTADLFGAAAGGEQQPSERPDNSILLAALQRGTQYA